MLTDYICGALITGVVSLSICFIQNHFSHLKWKKDAENHERELLKIQRFAVLKEISESMYVLFENLEKLRNCINDTSLCLHGNLQSIVSDCNLAKSRFRKTILTNCYMTTDQCYGALIELDEFVNCWNLECILDDKNAIETEQFQNAFHEMYNSFVLRYNAVFDEFKELIACHSAK